MKYWSEYSGHTVDIKGKIDNTIYTFDIESTSYLLLNNKVIPAVEYQNLNDLDQQKSESYSCMYIWQFGINDTVYYGRTWQEFVEFLNRLESNCNLKKIVEKIPPSEFYVIVTTAKRNSYNEEQFIDLLSSYVTDSDEDLRKIASRLYKKFVVG